MVMHEQFHTNTKFMDARRTPEARETGREVMTEQWRSHLEKRLARHGQKPLTDQQVLAIRAHNGTLDEVALEFDRSKKDVLLIKQMKIHVDVSGPSPVRVHKRTYQRYAAHRLRRQFSDEIVVNIRASDSRMAALAEVYGVDYRTIWQIKNGKSYKDVIQPPVRPWMVPKRGGR